MTAPLRLGTRGSALAMAQSGQVAEAVTAATGRPVELVEVVTAGDRSNAPVHRLGVGVFVSALRDALTAGTIDFAVHSYKDLPTAAAGGLHIAAVPARQDPRDALVARDGRTLAELPPGATVGTGALRRIAQLHALGLQLEVTPIRGNVDTRLGRVLGPEADLDAVVLARAGLARLGRLDVITESLDPMLMLPAPAQGALAVECRVDDQDLVELLAVLDHAPSRAAVTAERAFLATLEAGCSAPVAAYAELAEGETGDEIYLRGAVISPDGTRDLRLSRTGTPADAAEIGKALAAELLELGADSILGHEGHTGPGTQQFGSTE
ncbi:MULTISPECIES: hydroxymethylbilane synthase [Micromonospora]|uniref:Porphobilinogen deaminase n=1 Tax=Micromonospora saelicesensis TaxID=285676 RepID=A0A1C4YHY9_9ACTN|nr:hydroxymethylbilane synthase [Micromonospora saelicesensis]RAN97892.1 Hydroxymethylbilane synthase [Micromonospora saelicesensis]RAO37960.1 Hydroxymethylbilane synthase [Micromonospora saelicesensis]RAO44142.1 Hydroxymethylbilane synthase [Micromonospora saelicesensis]RAO61460.1 Hydroxymethylbilane synthase [Micromonospora saelicesensis]RAO62964.1 Hydroxymethylbilane synthase [Micromonospora saelicesensis]